jgi:hypothetical protein
VIGFWGKACALAMLPMPARANATANWRSAVLLDFMGCLLFVS